MIFQKKQLKTEMKFRPSHLRAVRAIDKNIVVKQSKNIAAFYVILKNTPEYGMELAQLTPWRVSKFFHLFPDKIRLFAAFYDELMIAEW